MTPSTNLNTLEHGQQGSIRPLKSHFVRIRQIAPFLITGLILFSSCSSSRKAAQTPDDVYYSPGAPKNVAASDEDGGYYSPNSNAKGDYYSTAPSDNYVRLKSQDQARWSYFDDYNAYDSYYCSPSISPYYSMGYGSAYGLGYGYGSSLGLGFGFGDPYMGWNSYFMWNSWYNPYFYNPYYGGGVLVVKGNGYGSTNNVYSHLRAFNGSSYRSGLVTRVNNSNNRSYRPATTAYSRDLRYGNGNQFSNGNNSTRNSNYYRPSNNNSNSNTNSYSRPSYSQPSSQPTRSYSPAPSGGGGGGGGVSRPGRH